MNGPRRGIRARQPSKGLCFQRWAGRAAGGPGGSARLALCPGSAVKM